MAAQRARTAHGDPERLTYAEAGARLGISPNAVRMKVARGTLVSVRINDRPYVLWPQPERAHEPHETNARARRTAHASSVHEGSALVAHLERENAFLRQQVDRQNHIIAGLIQRFPDTPELSAGDAPRSENKGSPSDDVGLRASAPLTTMEQSSETLDAGAHEVGWRRWWRRMTGGG
jgi:hypothetical protein